MTQPPASLMWVILLCWVPVRSISTDRNTSGEGDCSPQRHFFTGFTVHDAEVHQQAGSTCTRRMQCRSLRSQACTMTEMCSRPGSIECFDFARLPTMSFFHEFPEIPDASTRLLNIAIGTAGQSFDMYVKGNDEHLSRQLAEHDAFAPIAMAIVNAVTSVERRSVHSPTLFVDLGCNLGLMSLMAMANGCDVLCVEPNEDLLPLVSKSILRNRFNGSSVVLQAAVSSEWREVGLLNRNEPSWGRVEEAAGTSAHAVALPLGEVLRGDALVLKVDVEWHEREAGLGLNEWLRAYSWQHLLIEAKQDRLAILSVFLQGCRGEPVVRVWREQYDSKVASWDLSELPLALVQLHDINDIDQEGSEDIWVECRPDPAWTV